MRDGSIFVDLIIMFLSISGYKGQEHKTTKRGIIPGGEISPLGSNLSRLAHPKDMVPGKLTRIIGGGDTSPHEYPYQVALFLMLPDVNEGLCGGTIMSTQWILTAAHCLEDAVHAYVYLGAYSIDLDESSLKDIFYIQSSDWVMHEKYAKGTHAYDIALIRLPQELTLDRKMIFIEIDQGIETHSGKWGKCLGWGNTVSGDHSTLLRSVELQIISNHECGQYSAYMSVLRDHHICASGEGLVGTCIDESGGPLVVDGIQVGIVSFGVADCIKGAPRVLTRVNKFSGWILDKTGLLKAENRNASRTPSPFKALYMGMMLCVATLNYFL